MKVAEVRSSLKVDQTFHSRGRLENTIKAASGLNTAILPAGPVSPCLFRHSSTTRHLLAARMRLQSAVPANPLCSAIAPDNLHANSKREASSVARHQNKDVFYILFTHFPVIWNFKLYSLKSSESISRLFPLLMPSTISSTPSSSPHSHLMHLPQNPHPTGSQLHPKDFKPQVKNKCL